MAEDLRALTVAMLAEHGLDAVAALTADGSVAALTDGILHITGLPASTYIGRSMWEQVHPDDLQTGSGVRLEDLRAGPVQATEFRLRHASGLWRHVAATPINLVDTRGYFVSVLRDQTPLALARNVVRAAGQSNDAQQALDAIAPILAEAVPVHRIGVKILDGNMERLVASWPDAGAAVASVGAAWRLTDDGLSSTRTGRARWVADSTSDRLAMGDGIASHLDVPIGGRTPGFVVFGCPSRDGLDADARNLVEQTARDVGPWLLIHAAQDAALTSAQAARRSSEALRKLAHTDALTGLPNRRAWDEEILRRIRPERPVRVPLAVAVLDLDHFKAYNDHYGHPAGDELLSKVATAWAGMLRGDDLLARIGGEEFGLLLQGCDLENGLTVLRGLLDAVPFQQTASAGVTSVRQRERAAAAVARADRALYAAKAAGRNAAIGEP